MINFYNEMLRKKYLTQIIPIKKSQIKLVNLRFFYFFLKISQSNECHLL